MSCVVGVGETNERYGGTVCTVCMRNSWSRVRSSPERSCRPHTHIILDVQPRVELPPFEQLHSAHQKRLVIGERHKLPDVKIEISHLREDRLQLRLGLLVKLEVRQVGGGGHERRRALSAGVVECQ